MKLEDWGILIFDGWYKEEKLIKEIENGVVWVIKEMISGVFKGKREILRSG